MHFDLQRALDTQLVNLAKTVSGSISVELDGRYEFELSPDLRAQFKDGNQKPYYRILSEQGEVLETSDGIRSPAPIIKDFLDCGMAPGTLRIRVCSRVVELWPDSEAEDLEEWHRQHPSNPVPEALPRRFRVEVGLSLLDLDTSLWRIRQRLIFGFGFLFFVIAFIPAWWVHQKLQPLATLSREAEGIDADHLDKRLTEEGADSEVRPLVASLNRALDRVADAYERQKRFTSDAAHELRTPISVIRTQAEVALRKPRPLVELVEVLGIVLKTALRLGELTESLLLLARHDSAAVPLRRQPVDLALIAREAATLLKVSAEVKGVRLEGSFSGPIPASGDAALLSTCLVKLIENAIRFTSPGGLVCIQCSGTPTPSVSVEDTGQGIPLEEQARIFERFYRVEPSRTRTDGGSGLGLAIARQIAQLHGARILVDSQVGQGSRFELRFQKQGPGD